MLFLTCNQSRGTNVAGAHNRIDKIFFCASPPTWLTCKSRITFILQGDKMYLKALNSGLVLDQGVEFLSVDNLPNVVGVSCCTSMFSYAIHDSSLIDKFHNISPVVHGCTTPLRVTNSHLPLVIDPFGAQNNIELPVVVAQNNNLPIVVEPVEAKIINDLPIVVQPTEAQNNNAKNRNQSWFIKYGKEYKPFRKIIKVLL